MDPVANHIECQFQRFGADGTAHCFLRDTDLKKYPNGCPSCVSLPMVESLLDHDARTNRAKYQIEIRNAIAEDRATLVLGAGVSMPMKMPNWLGLISKMAGYARQYGDYADGELRDSEDIRRLCVRLEQELINGELTLFNGVNVLESGQYIEQALRDAADKKSVQELLKETLSIIIAQSLTPTRWIKEKWKKDYPRLSPRRNQLLAARHNSLCAAAYLLCAKNGFRRALTYNFDTLVQEYLIDIFRVNPDRIFTHPGEWSKYPRKGVRDPIDMFHVHGCIPRRENLQKPSRAFPKKSEQIILTESSYYDTEQSGAYNWQNSLQSYYLNRDHCVFVGFSADDYNFRRILRQMGNGKHPKHYLILTIDSVAQETWAAVCRRRLCSSASAEQVREEALQLLRLQLDMKTKYWNRYDFHPIWVTVNDIPTYLPSLVEPSSGGGQQAQSSE